MSETSIQLRTQISPASGNVSVDSNGKSIMALGTTQAQKYAKQKPRFVEFACSHQEVFRYVVLVTNAVVPKSFWGSKANLKLVFRCKRQSLMTWLHCSYFSPFKDVKEFIDCRRHETLNLHHILQNFSTTACDWLSPSSHQDRVSVSDSLKRRELLEDFLFWYFDSFVMPLLRVRISSLLRPQALNSFCRPPFMSRIPLLFATRYCTSGTMIGRYYVHL
ncbi:hypothetical protein CVT26_008148 [Gymnopilus dilepis]|uniref:Telomerase reverse transcriptase n=1 Tax=Gymnopilus dilepis TaxID=231916 RepID=A0A409WCR3_9AGAR|nr:hypothetical protein CVT26_008148 [Gymnopilus dilepis]